MNNFIRSACISLLTPLVKNQVYTQKTGLAAGLKRRGGFGFLPSSENLSREHMLLKSLHLEGKTVYDVGGHVGLLSAFFARETGETGYVVTFEPNPENYAAMLDLVDLNSFKNVKVIKMGLGRKQEKRKFIVAGSALGTADPNMQKRYVERKNVQVLSIEIDTMDNQIAANDLPQPDFVKIDVEGLEIDVLHGMTQTMTDHRPQIILELHGTSEQEVAELLLSFGYKIIQVEDDIEITKRNIDKVRGHLYAEAA